MQGLKCLMCNQECTELASIKEIAPNIVDSYYEVTGFRIRQIDMFEEKVCKDCRAKIFFGMGTKAGYALKNDKMVLVLV